MTKSVDIFRLPRSARFISEQKGAAEAFLTTRLAQEFSRARVVNRAYLVRVAYGEDTVGIDVVLAIRSLCEVEDVPLINTINDLFASIFGPGEHLDVLFIRSEQEEEVRRVCRPFYSATSADRETPKQTH
jgi:SseB protein C-terminal domain